MENKQEEKKGKKALKTLAIVAITVGICYEIFGRKNQDVKQACSWVKGKIQSKKSTPNVVENKNNNISQNHQQNNKGGGDWNNKRKN